jgi:hypothetical protein
MNRITRILDGGTEAARVEHGLTLGRDGGDRQMRKLDIRAPGMDRTVGLMLFVSTAEEGPASLATVSLRVGDSFVSLVVLE